MQANTYELHGNFNGNITVATNNFTCMFEKYLQVDTTG